MKVTQINELITYLKAEPTISAIFGDRIYYNLPRVPDDLVYLCLVELSDDTQDCENKTLLEMRVIAGDNNTAPLTMRGYIETLQDFFAVNRTFGTYKTYQIDNLNDLFLDLDFNKRYNAITTFIFKEII